MLTRPLRITFVFMLLSLAFFLFYVSTAIAHEDAEWFETHDVWEDIIFRTGTDSYAYTTFYDPVVEKQLLAESLNSTGIDGSGYDDMSGPEPIELTAMPDEDDDILRVYLPVEHARISFQHMSAVRIGEITYHSGDSLTDIVSGETVDVAFIGNTGRILAERSVRFYVACGTATIYVQLQNDDIDDVSAIANNKSLEGTISYETVDVDGSVDCGGTGVLHARGNNNTYYAKKSYSLNLDETTSLLGMKTASKWALRAAPDDNTMLMDKIVLDVSKGIDVPYEMDAEYVNVYIDGRYEGLYLMTQRTKVDGGTVDIDDGYLMEFEWSERYVLADQGFKSEHRNVVVHSPEDLDESELNELESYVQEAEDAVYNEAGVNPQTGKTWFEYLDAASWIKEYWIQEFFINYDADFTSTFFTKKVDDPLLYAGPCWDFDKAYWYTYYNDRYQSNMLTIRGRLKPSWLQELDKKADFREARCQYYLDSFSQVVKSIEHQELPVLIKQIGPSLLMMYDRYGYDSLGQDYVDGIETMFTDWLDARLAFYDDYMSHPGEYVILDLDIPENETHEVVFAIRKGTAVSLPEEIFNHKEWAYTNGQVFHNGDTITEDTRLIPTDYDKGDKYYRYDGYEYYGYSGG